MLHTSKFSASSKKGIFQQDILCLTLLLSKLLLIPRRNSSLDQRQSPCPNAVRREDNNPPLWVEIGPDVQVLLPCVASLLGRGWTNALSLFNDWGCMQNYQLLCCGQTWNLSLLAGIAIRREVLRGFHLSESLVAFGLLVFRSLFGFAFGRLFAFHLFSYNLRIVDWPQDVLMSEPRACMAWAKNKADSRF